MSIHTTMAEALGTRPEMAGIACIDARSGMVISAALRDDDVEAGIESAASCASDLCATPEAVAEETLVVGSEWMHVLVRATSCPEIIVIGVAPAAGNLALLVSCTRDVARRLPVA